MSEKLFVIIKNGYYWRPNSRGYTGNRFQAGFYTEQEAKEVCDHPNSSCKYKPVSELFELAEVKEVEANIETIKQQMQLHASEATKSNAI